MKVKQLAGMLFVVLALVGLTRLTGLVAYSEKHRQPSLSGLQQENYYKLCRVSEGCQIELEAGAVSLAIEPEGLPALEPLDINVVLEGFEASSVTMEFVGRDMAMSLMSFPLIRESNRAGADIHRGTGSITFCTTDHNMVWLAKLVITSETIVRTVTFELGV